MAKLLTSWGSMASPVLKKQAASQGTQPSTPSSRDHWPALVSPLPWSLWAWLTMEGGRMAWLWALNTEAWAWCVMQQLWTLLLRATIKTLPDRLVLGPQKLRPGWQVHRPFFEWSCEEACWCVWWPQGVPMAPPASVPGCGQGKCCQHIGLCASLI